MATFKKVKDQTGIDAVAGLAHEIWNQHFVSIIGQAQVDYMLDKFQSTDAVARQLEEGYEYYLVLNNEQQVGYLALLPEVSLGRMMISKIYLKKQTRGLGVGSQALNYVKALASEHKIRTIWLTVNKYNKNSIDWYLKKGFLIIDSINKDIGQGYFMDDYIMALKSDESAPQTEHEA